MRTNLLTPVLPLLLLFPTSAWAQKSDASAAPPVEQQVLAAEDAYIAAEVNRDEAALRRLVDDRFVFNTSKGTTTGKEELISSILGMSMVDQTIRERSVVVEGDVALVFGTSELTFAGEGDERSVAALRYTAAYVNRDGQWRMLALQMQRRAED